MAQGWSWASGLVWGVLTILTFAFSRLKSAVAPVLFFFRKKLDFGMALRLSPLSRSRTGVRASCC